MRISDLSHLRLILLHSCLFLIPIAAWTQTPTPQSRIVERVNESALVTLRGNTHPLAQPQFDQGAAPPDLPMQRGDYGNHIGLRHCEFPTSLAHGPNQCDDSIDVAQRHRKSTARVDLAAARA